MDKTGLFQKLTPTSGLYIKSIPSVKKNKSWIIIVLYTNSIKTD